VGRASTPNVARAFAPGHLTGFFVPDLTSKDPRGRGSTGAGLVLDRGVVAEARFDPEGPTALRLRSRPRTALVISREVASRLRAGIPGTLEVDLLHHLPIGQGLGMSAAGAVATALAVARALGVPKQRAWETAHLAELFHQGGLGGVAAIGGGGLEHRTRPGVPPYGEVRHAPSSLEVRLTITGPPMPTSRILSDPRRVAMLRRAGHAAERAFSKHPTSQEFLTQSERFTDRVGLDQPVVSQTIRSLRATDRFAAQAMFGNVVFSVPRPAASRRAPEGKVGGSRELSVGVGRWGARLLSGASPSSPASESLLPIIRVGGLP
jgi:pantoate kinase